jgi:glycosyltransferase involved in cell wall biosynthesis
MVDLSIIVPVFNSETYIDRCISSVLNQNITGYELIIVDDCSEDRSMQIIKKWQERYPGIISVLSTQRRGMAGGARNLGMRHVKGRYLLFLDSDDYLVPGTLQKFIEGAVDSGADIVYSPLYNRIENGRSRTIKYIPFEYSGHITQELHKKLLLNQFIIWCCLYSRDFILKNALEFPEGLSFEDNVWSFISALKSESVHCVPFPINNHTIRGDSLSQTLNAKFQLDLIKISNMNFEYALKSKEYNYCKEEIELQYFYSRFIGVMNTCLYKFSPRTYSVIKESGREVMEKVPDIMRNMYIRGHSKRQRIAIRVALRCPRLYWFLTRIDRKYCL